jgi:hypothetical protein
VVLAEGSGLPIDPMTIGTTNIWSRNNEWLLRTALARSDAEITLLLLWNGLVGEGPGGTAGMVGLARQWAPLRLKIVRLDPLTLDETSGGDDDGP